MKPIAEQWRFFVVTTNVLEAHLQGVQRLIHYSELTRQASEGQ